ncbi:3'-5' exonuclease [Neoroseomonas oryzicola]|uniref:3'-5' exonuclease n=1 Tax=Neoroseomonas oryzicola TaxID=535904 RepID=A0A9X9WNP6_9PROT|nr:3'-5' exonuclease [Neoroseomonas oryzicola]NKE16104.1 3'-5' exonuclease [Neoroseomonas oryzicola]
MIDAVKRLFWRASLADHGYLFLFDPPPAGEVVSLDCETTGLDTTTDEILAIAAVPVVDGRIQTSRRFEAFVKPDRAPTADSIKVHRLRARDLEAARPMRDVLPELLRFIGSRPLLGYYIDFDVRMLDRYAKELLQVHLPNRRIEVSSLYYDRKYGKAPPGTTIDLRFASMLEDLGIPQLEQHIAVNDAVMAAMAWLQLTDLVERGQRLKRERRRDATAAPLGA